MPVILFFLLLLGLSNPLLKAEEIRIGLMTHLSGEFQPWGQAYLEGITLAKEEFTDNLEVQLISEDTRFDSQLTATAAKKLLDFDKVDIALISTFTEVMVAGPLFEKAKTPLLVFGDSGGQIDMLGDYIFSSGTWVDGYALAASKFLSTNKKVKKVVLITSDNAWSQSTAKTFKLDFEKSGGSILANFNLNPNDSDFKTTLTKIKILPAQAIFAPITANVVAFFKQAYQLKVNLPILTAGGALDVDVIKTAPTAVEGHFVSNSYLNQKRSEAKHFLKLYQNKYKKKPKYPSVTARGYDGMQAVLRAIRQVRNKSASSHTEALYQLNFKGAGFDFKMSKAGSARLSVAVLEVKNGKLEVAENK